MKKLIPLCLFILLMGCKDETEPLYGTITVTGTTKDIVSGVPIPNAAVYLYAVEERYNGIGYSATVTDIAVQDTADSLGNYSLTVEAEGELGFEFGADPHHPLYVNSSYTVGSNHQRIESIGSHIVNQACHRSAYAQILLTNVAPVDTPSFLSMQGYDQLVIRNFFNDTVVYLKLVGRSEYPNNVRLNKDNLEDHTYSITAGPWDTIPMQFNY